MRHPDSATVAQLDAFDEVIDVRSPSEFAEDHVPGAINCPVLDDAERAEVGTLHKQVSPFDARRRGAALVARNIAAHLETVLRDRPKSWRPLVYCWRGGKRSGAMTHVLREIGWRASQLEGGYKAYRREVIAQLESLPSRFRFAVICGETGSAKSRLLEALAAHGAQVLDLEHLARHRGSVLGAVPAAPQPPQKWFETLVWSALRHLDPARPVFVEAESRKIGEVQVPEKLIEAMRAARCVRLDVPMDARVRFLIREYGHFLRDKAGLKAQLDCLAGLHGRRTIDAWKEAADRGDWETLVTDLLTSHYDPAYRRSTERNFARFGDATVVSLCDLGADALARTARRLSYGAARLADPAGPV